MDKDQAIKQLEVEIIRAFQDVKYPGDDQLLYSNADYEEGHIAFAFFHGKSWQDVLHDAEHLKPHYASVWFLSAQAFHYYLPALLLTALKWEEAGMIGDDVAQGLAPPPLGVSDDPESFMERTALLTPEQKRAVYSLFVFLAAYHHDDFYDSYPAAEILTFWSKEARGG